MDIKQLLEKMDQFAGQAVGQKPGDQWRGNDKAPPGKKLVGDSILKDLQKGKTPKNREQELSEEFEAFLQALEEENLGTHPKRPGRKSDRHARGHEPLPRYKTVKTDESMSDKDIELQDYRSMSDKEFQNAYKMTKTEWINKNKSLVIKNPDIKKGLGLDEAGSPAQQAAIAIAMKKAGKKPKNEGAEQDPIVAKVVKQMRPGLTGLNMGNEAFLYFAYELGKQRARDAWEDYLPAIRAEYEKGLNEDANTDNKLAKLLTRFVNQSEGADRAVALDAIEYIKKMGHIEQFATSLDYFGVDLDEGWESGPEEYEEPYDDADDAYDRQRQEKIDTEAEKEWAKLPKVSTYQCIGRGANMEPNQKFGPEFDTLEKALEYRAEIMKDPKTPHPEHIGINTLTRVIDEGQINEASFNPPKDKEDYDAKMGMLWKLQQDPNTHKDPVLKQKIIWQMNALRKAGEQAGYINNDIKDINDYQKRRDVIYRQLANPANVANYSRLKQELINLNNLARKQGIKIEESRAHDKLSKWFKDRELAQKYASGELKIPTPQERKAALEKPKKEKVDEYGANNPPQGITVTTPTTPQNVDPKQAQQLAQNLNVQKTALGQLKQLNPDINPQKAAMAATKDLATMNPQEKEVLAQVAKTLSPALGSPAFGSIKTALQKSQVQAKK